MGKHSHPKDSKANIAEDIRDFVQRDDPEAGMRSLTEMTAGDLTALSIAIERAAARQTDMLEALKQLRAFIGVTHGEGPDAHIPESVPTRIGIPVKLGEIMRRVSAAIAKAGG